jgi:hypothetical protein
MQTDRLLKTTASASKCILASLPRKPPLTSSFPTNQPISAFKTAYLAKPVGETSA